MRILGMMKSAAAVLLILSGVASTARAGGQKEQVVVPPRGEVGTGRALEIAEFFQRNRSLRIAADVHRFRQTLSRDRFISGDSEAMRLHCLTEQRAASGRGQCGRTNNDKRQI